MMIIGIGPFTFLCHGFVLISVPDFRSFQYLTTPAKKPRSANRARGYEDCIDYWDRHHISCINNIVRRYREFAEIGKYCCEEHYRNCQQHPEVLRVPQGLPHKRRKSVMLNAQLSDRTEDLSWFCASRTVGSTVAALMAEPYIRVAEELVFQPPLCLYHLFPREWFVLRRYITDN